LIDMASKSVFQYLKRMATSLLIMVLITYGMATENPWLQYGSIIIVLALQMGYQVLKSIRAAPLVNSNMEEAARVKSGNVLMEVKEGEVKKAKARVKEVGGLGLGKSTLALMFIPLAIFMGTGYVLGILFPGIPSWQSFAVGFLLSMPFSLILQARSGIAKGPIVAPNSYHISRNGIVFDHLKHSYIIHFPLKNLNVDEEKHFIEVEGQPSGAMIIPERLKLFTKNADKLHKILIRFTETSEM